MGLGLKGKPCRAWVGAWGGAWVHGGVAWVEGGLCGGGGGYNTACLSTPTPIQPHLTYTERDYMILLLFDQKNLLFFVG